jgi:hypothetical protein
MNKLKNLLYITLITTSIASCTLERQKEDVVNNYTLELNGTNYKFKDFDEDNSIDAILTKPSLDIFGSDYRIEFVKPQFQNKPALYEGVSVQNRYLTLKLMNNQMQVKTDSLVKNIIEFEKQVQNQ